MWFYDMKRKCCFPLVGVYPKTIIMQGRCSAKCFLLVQILTLLGTKLVLFMDTFMLLKFLKFAEIHNNLLFVASFHLSLPKTSWILPTLHKFFSREQVSIIGYFHLVNRFSWGGKRKELAQCLGEGSICICSTISLSLGSVVENDESAWKWNISYFLFSPWFVFHLDFEQNLFLPDFQIGVTTGIPNNNIQFLTHFSSSSRSSSSSHSRHTRSHHSYLISSHHRPSL